MMDYDYKLTWTYYQNTFMQYIKESFNRQNLVDCTLSAEGKSLKAHRFILSACSPYFESLLNDNYENHPLFILKDVKFNELEALMSYIYQGEVELSEDQLMNFMKLGESLKIKGLTKESIQNINDKVKKLSYVESDPLEFDNHVNTENLCDEKKIAFETEQESNNVQVCKSFIDSPPHDLVRSRENSPSSAKKRKRCDKKNLENKNPAVKDQSYSKQESLKYKMSYKNVHKYPQSQRIMDKTNLRLNLDDKIDTDKDCPDNNNHSHVTKRKKKNQKIYNSTTTLISPDEIKAIFDEAEPLYTFYDANEFKKDWPDDEEI